MPRGRAHYQLTLNDVLDAHDEALRYGGLHGVIDIGLVESAIRRPYQTFEGRRLYPRIYHKSAALVESLAGNHGFVDGNKRTALLSLGVLLENSGYTLAPQVTNEELEEAILNVATSAIGYKDLASWFRSRIVWK